MPFGNIAYWPILIAAVASFAFGAVWYGTLSRQWMQAQGKTAADMARAKAEAGTVPVPFIVCFIAELIMAWMLAGILLHLARSGMTVSIRAGLISGAFLWLGFVITTLATNHAFQGVKRSLTLIDGAHWLGVLLVQGAVLGWWGAP